MAGLGLEQPDLPTGFVHRVICWGQSSPQVPPGFVGCTKEEQGCKGPNAPAPGSSPMALGYFRAV